ncbi:MAG: glycosyltransferase family 39 protein [Burkholderiales bacterium]
MRRALGFCAFFLLGGLLLAAHITNAIAPERAPITRIELPGGWMSTPSPGVRGYYRHRLDIAFEPRHAWIAIAAEDYKLYVNGSAVGSNSYLLRAGTAFQDRWSAQAQRLVREDALPRGGGAQSAKSAKREWRMLHFYDLTPRLKRGPNLIALYVQSEGRNRAAVFGNVMGHDLDAEISGDPRVWRTSSEGGTNNGMPWFDPGVNDLDWQPAQPSAPPEELPLYVAADPAVWRAPFAAAPIASPLPAQEQIFAAPLSPGAHHGWVRVWSHTPYDLFVGERWAGEGQGGDSVDAFDLSPFLDGAPVQLSLRLDRPAAASGQTGWIAVDGKIGAQTLSTATGWRSLAAYHPRWQRGEGTWTQAVAHDRTAAPGPIIYQRSPEPGWGQTVKWFVEGLALAAALAGAAWVLGAATRRDRAEPPVLIRGCWLLGPALFGILAVETLRARFAESDSLLIFLAPGAGPLWLATGPLLLLATLRWVHRGALPGPGTLRAALQRVSPLMWLGAICTVALALRLAGLEFQPPSGDDYTSWEAARGILREGLPRAASGILYTRSPLFHYLLAGWMSLFGDGLASVRAFSLVPSLGTVIASYALVRAIARSHVPALLTALALALDPWLLGITNLIRFYQLMQFFAVLSVLYFLKGFIWREGKAAQTLFFVFATCAVLSQEIFATTFAAFFLVFLLCYRPFGWRQDRNVWLGFMAMMLLIWLDMRIFSAVSLTPHVALSSRSEPLFVPHLTDVLGGDMSVLTQLATDFFWMNNGENALWTILFLAGLVYWAKRPEPAMLTLYAVVLVSVPILAVLVVPVNGRYGYGLYPVFLCAALITAWAMVRDIASAQSGASRLFGQYGAKRYAGLAAAILIAAYSVSAEFGKIGRSYSAYREIDYRRAWDYVASHRRPQDKIAAVRTPGAGVVFGGADYYMMVGPAFDGLYQRGDEIVDRWAGGKLLWKVDQLREVLLRNERVWLVVDDPRLPRMGAGYTAFLLACCGVQSEFFGGQVLLWERSAGRFYNASDQGGGADSF